LENELKALAAFEKVLKFDPKDDGAWNNISPKLSYILSLTKIGIRRIGKLYSVSS
jgi:hypothetical protein